MSDNPYQAPAAKVVVTGPKRAGPTLRERLFSFKGRFSRSQYWGFAMGIPLILMILAVALLSLPGSETEEGSLTLLSEIVVIALYMLAVWISYAGTAKRFHDRGKTGWMVLIGFIPYLGMLWILIECGCLSGTPVANRYGLDPRQGYY